MRLRRIPGTKEALALYPDLVLPHPEEFRGKWQGFFQNNRPIYLELGMGKGNFINTMARKNPDVNFLGMEFREEMVYKAVMRLGDYRGNLGFIWFDAMNIEEIFAPGEISRIFLNFSDPWPKARHAKRRLTHRNFLDKYRRICKAGSEIHFKTDNKDLFEFSLNEFSQSNYYLKNITLDLHHSDVADNVMTEYEERFYRDYPIYRCEALMLAEKIRLTNNR